MRYKEYIRSLPAYKPPTLLAGPQTDLVKLSSNENPLGPSPRAIAALQQHIAAVHRYPDSGAAALRRALADHADLQPEQVLCANGSDELVFLICAAFLREGDAALMAEGTFISYYLRTTEMGGQARRIPLHHYTHDLPAMADAIDRDTRIVFVCNPNNPTGTTVGAAELDAFLARIPDDVLVVFDEAYIEYAVRSDFPDVLPQIAHGTR
jgi:histidinol-phosphate aminotransferase